MLHVGSLEEVRSRSPLVVSKGPVPIVIFHHDGELHAVDNRCPHMGFPLHRGTVEDGILTCYWHHARFDLVSGCTFNLFADDVDSYAVQVRDGQVYLDVTPPPVDPVRRWSRRLTEGMEQNLSLIMGKSVVGLHHSGVSHDDVARQGSLFTGSDTAGTGVRALRFSAPWPTSATAWRGRSGSRPFITVWSTSPGTAPDARPSSRFRLFRIRRSRRNISSAGSVTSWR